MALQGRRNRKAKTAESDTVESVDMPEGADGIGASNVDEMFDSFEPSTVESGDSTEQVEPPTTDEAPLASYTEQGTNEMTETVDTPTVDTNAPAEPTFMEKANLFLERVTADAEDPEGRGLNLKEGMTADMLRGNLRMWLTYEKQINELAAKIEGSKVGMVEWRKRREASDDPRVKELLSEMAELEKALAEKRKEANALVSPDDVEMPDDERETVKEEIKALKSALKNHVEVYIDNAAINGGYAIDDLKWYRDESPNIRTRTVSETDGGKRGAPKFWRTLRIDGNDVGTVQDIVNRLKTKGAGRITTSGTELKGFLDEFGVNGKFEFPREGAGGQKHTVTMIKTTDPEEWN